MRRVLVVVVVMEVEIGENDAHSFTVVAIETVSAYDVRWVADWSAVVGRCDRP